MNIAIIGCGYLGSGVARYLQTELGYIVTATTRTPERVAALQKIAAKVFVATGDDEISLYNALQNQDTVLLSVAPSGNEQVDTNGYTTTYLHTAKNLVTILQQLPQIKHLIYTSSCSVYGNTNGEWVNEDSVLAPTSEQAQILYETEQILLQAASVRVCIFRLGGIYGPGRMLNDRSSLCGTNLPGTGENFTNWSHLDDIAAGIGFAIQNRLDGIYNLVDDKPVLSREILDQICEINGLAKVSWEPSAFTRRGNNVRVSNQKLKASGYKLIHSEIQL
jgi:nucleoside-diphosphate-sugar epimerase